MGNKKELQKMGAIRNMKSVLLKGPILSRSGYGEHTRCVYRALQSRPDLYDVYIEPTNWGRTAWSYAATKENQEIIHCITKRANYSGIFNVSLQVLIPNEWLNLAEKNIGVTAGIETDLASAQWVDFCRQVDHVIVVSEHSKNVFVNSVYKDHVEIANGQFIDLAVDESHIDVIGYPVKQIEEEEINLELETDFNFLAVAQAGPRKCLDATVRWFAEEFKDENVGLVLKSNIVNNSIPDRTNLTNLVRNWVSSIQDRKCKVYLLHGNLNDNQIHHLYNKVRYSLEKVQQNAVWENVIEPESKWAFSDEKSYKKSLRNVYEAYRSKKAMAEELKEYIEEEMSEEKIYQKYVDVINAIQPPEVFEVSEWLKEIENNLETHD